MFASLCTDDEQIDKINGIKNARLLTVRRDQLSESDKLIKNCAILREWKKYLKVRLELCSSKKLAWKISAFVFIRNRINSSDAFTHSPIYCRRQLRIIISLRKIFSLIYPHKCLLFIAKRFPHKNIIFDCKNNQTFKKYIYDVHSRCHSVKYTTREQYFFRHSSETG